MLVLVGFGLGISGVPAPLYGVWAKEWDFAPITTTIVFAIYAVAALVSVLVTGPLTDRFGRKPALVVASAGLLAGLVVFVAATNVAMLLVARAIHGLSVGAIVVAAAAAMLDLRPDIGARTGKRTGVSFNVGIAASIMAAAVTAEYLPRPLITPFLVMGVIGVVMLASMVLMREPHPVAQRMRMLRVSSPRVPREIMADFRFSAVGVAAAWSVLGVFLSLYPTIALISVDSDNLVFGGAVVAVSAAAASVSQLIAVIWTPRTAAVTGDVGTAVALLSCVVALGSGSMLAILAASAFQGFFFGLAFGSSLRHLGEVVPSQTRGEVMSAFYLIAYGALAAPTILAGWAATRWDPEQIIAPFFGCVAAMCLVAAVLGWRLPAPDADVDLDD